MQVRLKSPELRSLIDDLMKDLGPSSLTLTDNWPEDLIATGLQRRGDQSRLMYIALALDEYGNVHTGEERYYFECELLHPEETVPYDVVERGERVTYEQLRNAIARNLDL
jgi:hypothetical protein